jgi:beta-galactosidase/beta-glucuronidase
MILFYLLGSYTGRVSWIITTNSENAEVQVEVVDANGVVVAIGDGVKGQVGVQNVKLWWPYSMVKTGAAYMYTLKVNIENKFLLCILSVFVFLFVTSIDL